LRLDFVRPLIEVVVGLAGTAVALLAVLAMLDVRGFSTYLVRRAQRLASSQHPTLFAGEYDRTLIVVTALAVMGVGLLAPLELLAMLGVPVQGGWAVLLYFASLVGYVIVLASARGRARALGRSRVPYVFGVAFAITFVAVALQIVLLSALERSV
jgi:hypothetical protein